MPAERVRFIHAANLRLDAPLQDTGPLPDDLQVIIQSATFTAWERIVEACLNLDADFLLLAGDCFDQHDPGLLGQAALVWGYFPDDWRRGPLDLVGPVFFNRRATINRCGDLFADLQEFGAKREIDKADQRLAEFRAQVIRVQFKNIGGTWFSWLAYNELGLQNNARLLRGYWSTEDLRTALHAQLLKP